MEKALPRWPFAILVAVALWGVIEDFQDGRWLILVLNAVVFAIAIWGLRLPRQQIKDRHQIPGTDEHTGQASGPHLASSTAQAKIRPRPHSFSAGVPMTVATVPAPVPHDLPIVDSFAVAAHIRMATTGTTARLSVALPEDTKVTPAVLISTLLTLGQRVLQDYRLTDRELPEVEVTAVERAATAPTSAAATGFTLGVTNDLAARHSSINLDSELLTSNDDGILLSAATLLAGAEHLLEVDDHPIRVSAQARHRTHGRHHGRLHSPASS